MGFGGSCFKKDLLALIYLAESQGLNEVAEYWYQVVLMNEYRKKRFFNIILEQMYNTIRNKKFAIFGLSFKKGTNDVRDSASAYLFIDSVKYVSFYLRREPFSRSTTP